MDKIIFFDGDCNLCNSAVQFILKWEINKEFKFASLQSDFAKENIDEKYRKDLSTIIYSEDNKFYYKSDAVLKISKYLKKPLNYIYYSVIVPRLLRDYIYMIISRNRKKFFKNKNVCLFMTKELKERFLN